MLSIRPVAFAFSLSLLAACGDDSSTSGSDTPDTAVTPDSSAPDASNPDVTPDGTTIPDGTPDTTPTNSATVAISAAAGGTVL